MKSPPDLDRLEGLREWWRARLEAKNLSPKTIRNYMDAVAQLEAFLALKGLSTRADDIHREALEAYLVHVRKATSVSTANTRRAALVQFFQWLHEEGDTPINPMAKIGPAKGEERPVNVVPESDLKALLKACSGRDFEARRDTALLRVFLNTGARLAEISNLKLEDVDIRNRELYVMGKGRRARELPVTGKALDSLLRYLKVRGQHKDADLDWVWLSQRGRLTDSGITQILRRRCDQAGIRRIHPHQLRHTWAHLMKSAGVSDDDLQSLGGWTTSQMLERYGRSTRAERARATHARVAPGDEY